MYRLNERLKFLAEGRHAASISRSDEAPCRSRSAGRQSRLCSANASAEGLPSGSSCGRQASPRSLFVADHGRVVGTWIMGNNYRVRSGYYGGYPAGYLRRLRALFPDKQRHCTCSAARSILWRCRAIRWTSMPSWRRPMLTTRNAWRVYRSISTTSCWPIRRTAWRMPSGTGRA